MSGGIRRTVWQRLLLLVFISIISLVSVLLLAETSRKDISAPD